MEVKLLSILFWDEAVAITPTTRASKSDVCSVILVQSLEHLLKIFVAGYLQVSLSLNLSFHPVVDVVDVAAMPADVALER